MLSDVPPYVTSNGDAAKPHGINSEGLKRRGFTRDSIKIIRDAYRVLYRSSLPLNEAKLEIARMAKESSELTVLSEFLSSTSGRSIIR